MFFFGNTKLNEIIRANSRSLVNGFASVLDIGGDVTFADYYLIPNRPDLIIEEFAENYDRIFEDYSQAVDKVVEKAEKQ